MVKHFFFEQVAKEKERTRLFTNDGERFFADILKNKSDNTNGVGVYAKN